MPARLKSLELQGYKTFATRTIFDYSGAITAIVGPNGSGKSNIADSIRWVLGEQSYTLLRGKKTEDMIFLGSEQRSRASMASATMVFDNSDGWLPIDFSEVAITRRAYRDGQNEYLINSQKVRLKDVSELLAKSGLAERTYTVIGQGLVDIALALKAEDRRRLFEEAAGIGLYRSRREESLRRLEETHRNLDRVKDILSELRPRLNSLEKQARRAQEYEQLKTDLNVLLLEWYGYHWHQAQKDLTNLNEIVHTRESLLNRTNEDDLLIIEKVTHLQSNFDTIQSDINAHNHVLSELFLRREGLSREKAITEERIRSQSDISGTIQNELSRIKDEIALNQDIVLIISDDLEKIIGEREDAQKQLNNVTEELNLAQANKSNIEQDIFKIRDDLNKQITRKNELQTIFSERENQINRLATLIEEKNISLNKSRDEMKHFKEQFRDELKVLKKFQSQKLKIDQDLLATQIKLKQNYKKSKDLIEKQTSLSSAIAQKSAQLEVLELAEQTKEGYSSGVQVINEAVRSKKIDGIRGYFSNYLVVPEELEDAIVALLGEYINSILIESDQALNKALDIVLEKSARAVLVPVSKIKHKNIKPVKIEVSEVIGRAADLITCSSEIKPIIEMVFSNAYIVKDRKTAIGLMKKYEDLFSVVTINGEVFYRNGTVIAGRERKSTLISRKRGIKNLQTNLHLEQEKLKELNIEIGNLNEEASNLEIEQADQEKFIRELSLEIQKSSEKQGETKSQIIHLQDQIDWLHNEIKNANHDVLTFKTESKQYQSEIINLEPIILNTEQLLKEKIQVLQAFDLDEFNRSLIHWNALFKVAEQAHSDITQRLEERNRSTQKLEEQRQELERHLSEIVTDIDLLNQKKAKLASEEDDTTLKIESTEDKLPILTSTLNGLEKEIQSLVEQQNQLKKRRVLLEQNYSEARINLARQQERFDSLQRKIEDDFGLVSFEYEESVSGPTPLPLAGLVESIPKVSNISPELEENIKELRTQIRRMGAINLDAKIEYQEVNDRYNFLMEQVADLEKAETDLRKAISELDDLMQQEFVNTFQAVSEEFSGIFSRLFAGGHARLLMTDSTNLSETGIEIEARLPGRRMQGLSLLSGGERSLTATALIFALLKVSPTPFCVLDEVDAMLDEANIGRFRDLLKELSQATQFIVVTHNRNTVQVADVLYGVTMGKDSSSQVISLRLDEIDKVI